MAYRKINLEFVVFEDESDAVIAELDSAIDRLDQRYTIFGGDVKAVPVKHSGKGRKSALRHTRDAGNVAISAVKLATQKIVGAYKKVI